MQLGSLLARLADETDAGAALQTLGDLALFCRVAAMGQRFDEAPGEYVANAARRFAATADAAAWLRLMGALERSDDIAAAALRCMLEWALARDAGEPAVVSSEAVAPPERSSHGCGHVGL